MYNASFSSQLIACSVISVFRTLLYTPHPFPRNDEPALYQEAESAISSWNYGHCLRMVPVRIDCYK